MFNYRLYRITPPPGCYKIFKAKVYGSFKNGIKGTPFGVTKALSIFTKTIVIKRWRKSVKLDQEISTL